MSVALRAVPISQLKVEDKAQVKTVEAVLVHYDSDLYDLTFKTARGTEVIDTTSNHPYAWGLAAARDALPARERYLRLVRMVG